MGDVPSLRPACCPDPWCWSGVTGRPAVSGPPALASAVAAGAGPPAPSRRPRRSWSEPGPSPAPRNGHRSIGSRASAPPAGSAAPGQERHARRQGSASGLGVTSESRRDRWPPRASAVTTYLHRVAVGHWPGVMVSVGPVDVSGQPTRPHSSEDRDTAPRRAFPGGGRGSGRVSAAPAGKVSSGPRFECPYSVRGNSPRPRFDQVRLWARQASAKSILSRSG
jgi:hypothetical protein